MKILILEGEASNKLGGAELSMFSYAKHIHEKGHEIFLTYEKGGDWLDPENSGIFQECSQVNSDSYRGQGFYSFFKNLQKFVFFARRHKIDFILTHTIHSFLFLRIANFFIQKPVVVYFKWIYSGDSIGSINKYGAEVVDKAIYLPSVKSYWKSNGVNPQSGELVLYDGINFDFKGTENNNPTNKITNAVFLGRIVESKGLHLIIEALRDISGIKLFVYGVFDDEGNKYHRLITNMVTQYGLQHRIKFMGFNENPIEEMVKYDLAIIPSTLYEAQCRVLLEAMATKTLVLVSKSGGMPTILGEEGKELVFEINSKSLGSKLQEIMSWDVRKIKEINGKLYQRFQQNYTETRTHSELDKFLNL